MLISFIICVRRCSSSSTCDHQNGSVGVVRCFNHIRTAAAAAAITNSLLTSLTNYYFNYLTFLKGKGPFYMCTFSWLVIRISIIIEVSFVSATFCAKSLNSIFCSLRHRPFLNPLKIYNYFIFKTCSCISRSNIRLTRSTRPSFSCISKSVNCLRENNA